MSYADGTPVESEAAVTVKFLIICAVAMIIFTAWHSWEWLRNA